VHLSTDMVGDEADNTLAVAEGEALARVAEAFREPVDPQPAVRVEHHLDDAGVLEPRCDIGAKCGAQHARAPHGPLGLERMQ